MSTTTVRMDDDLKAEVNAILDSMGLNFNTFVNMAPWNQEWRSLRL